MPATVDDAESVLTLQRLAYQIEAATGVPDAEIHGVHLRLPGCGEKGPTLEIFQYNRQEAGPRPAVNRPGLAHIAFAVDDVEAASAAVLDAGGGVVGDVVSLEVVGPDDQQGKETAYERVREFAKRFEARNGTTVCRDLIQCDISTPEGLAMPRDQGLWVSVCPKFVQDAAEILEEMLGEST